MIFDVAYCKDFSKIAQSLDNAPSTPALEEAIAQVRTSYDSRIQSASDRLKRKIREMELEHQNWVTKEEEECQEIIECLMRNHAFQKGVRAEVLCPQPPPVAPAHEDDEPVALLNDACNQDQQAQIEMDLAEDYLNGNISEDLGSTTPQKSRDVPTACCFNLSSPESSLGVDDDILLDVL